MTMDGGVVRTCDMDKSWIGSLGRARSGDL